MDAPHTILQAPYWTGYMPWVPSARPGVGALDTGHFSRPTPNQSRLLGTTLGGYLPRKVGCSYWGKGPRPSCSTHQYKSP